MKFETKYSIGDILYSLFRGEIRVGGVDNIKLNTYNNGDNTSISYELTSAIDEELGTERTNGTINEDGAYSTKQEAGEAWMRQQRLEVGIKNV